MKYLINPIKDQQRKRISEGWIYTKSERSIHKNYYHHGIDYEVEYGSPVYSCADGIAVASYHRFPINDKVGFPILFKGEPVSNGFGIFVQIYHSQETSGIKGGQITQYGHLSGLENPKLLKVTTPIKIDLASRIVRRNNRKRKNKLTEIEINKLLRNLSDLTIKFPWISNAYGFNFSNDINAKESYLYTPTQLNELLESNSQYVMRINQGDIIGYAGTSSVFYGNLPYDETNLITLNNSGIPTFENCWDEVHLHFEIAQREWDSGRKINQIDPYGIYKSAKWYQNNPKSIFLDKQ